ncbi:GLE1-like family protein [Theileria parva strain Muguga]|uniref:Uncharacterized protein n=1 Tax=Theileria parva TaxID=5875 RepID=Q4N8C9_THEPA|nr:GLE1-like family protein [Theileria parva strain Muguga]EAN33779.1 GLE1-like family protein [Theileria parva strain Muguga]|eukprot:XP_766062.1 hypothetical protein [Theileria parva strain Muguga]
MKAVGGVTFNFDESVLVEDRKLQIPLNFYKTGHNFTTQFKLQLIQSHTTRNITINTVETVNFSDKTVNFSDKTVNFSDKSVTDVTGEIVKDVTGESVKDVTGESVKFGYLDSKQLEELIDENCVATRNVYNSVITETINEFQRLELLEKQKLERENFEKKRIEQEKLENQRKQIQNSHNENLTLHNENLTLQGEKLTLQGEKLTLQGEKLTLQGEKLTLQGEKLTLQGEKLTLQGEKLTVGANKFDDISWDYVPKNRTILFFDDLREKFIKFERIYSEVRSNSELKQVRIDLSKRVKICLNSIANTQKQVDLTFKTLSSLLQQCNSEDLKIFTLFKIVEGVLNCCEQGQIYINPKSVWSFSRLLASIDKINPDFNTIFITLLTLKTKLIIPKFYLTRNDTFSEANVGQNMTPDNTVELGKLYEYPVDVNEEIVYNKRLSSYLRLYLSYLCIKNDFTTIWSYYANVVNSSWNTIFIQFIPCILITILNITSYFMHNIYKLQFKKVLVNINKLLNEKLMRCNNTSSVQMYIGQLQQFYHDFNSGVKLTEPEGYKMKYKEEDLRNDI